MSNIDTLEIWKPVNDFEGFYSVSNFARVRSEARVIKRKTRNGDFCEIPIPEKILSTPPNSAGYLTVQLCRDSQGTTAYVHDLVAQAFLGEKPTGQQVRHLDDDKNNCTPANLAFGTRRDNALDAVRNGKHSEASRTECDHGHPYTEDNTARYPSAPNVRICLTCKRESTRRARKQQRLAKVAA